MQNLLIAIWRTCSLKPEFASVLSIDRILQIPYLFKQTNKQGALVDIQASQNQITSTQNPIPFKKTQKEVIATDNASSSKPISQGYSAPTQDSQPHKRPVVSEKFHGNTSWTDYYLHFEMCADLNGWGREEMAKHLAVSLRGNAQRILKNHLPQERTNYDSLVKKLEERFGTEGQFEMFKAKLLSTKKTQKETYQELAENIGDLVQKAYPSASADMIQSLTLDRFVEAITDHEVKIHVKTAKVKDVCEAAVRACKIDAIYAAEGMQTKPKRIVQSINVSESSSENQEQVRKSKNAKSKTQSEENQVSQPQTANNNLDTSLTALTKKIDEMNNRMKTLEDSRQNQSQNYSENQNFGPNNYRPRRYQGGPHRDGRSNYRPQYNTYDNGQNYQQNGDYRNSSYQNQNQNQNNVQNTAEKAKEAPAPRETTSSNNQENC